MQYNSQFIKEFFHKDLENADPILANIIKKEKQRQNDEIELIASENLVSAAVLEAQGSILTNKYAEGYPNKRYYGGCQVVDEVENLAIERAKKLFKCNFANVQPHSGSQMNQQVFFALLKPGDCFMGMSLSAGGHLTHGSPVNLSGKWFNPVSYGVTKQDNLIDMEEVARVAKKSKPKLIIAGATAYTREIDWQAFRKIADEVGAYLMADVSHIAGLIAAGQHSSPINYAHVVTTTTHKSLRGPRGGLILTNDAELAKKIDKAVFPGMQGGPLMHIIAAKAVAFGEALQPQFIQYAKNVVTSAQTLANSLMQNNIAVVTGGTDNHMVLVNLTSLNITGKALEQALEQANIICNKNNIPFDPLSSVVTSGIRLGTPSSVTRGLENNDFKIIAQLISQIAFSLSKNTNIDKSILEVKKEVKQITQKYPIY